VPEICDRRQGGVSLRENWLLSLSPDEVEPTTLVHGDSRKEVLERAARVTEALRLLAAPQKERFPEWS
jgi:hypothetical protein